MKKCLIFGTGSAYTSRKIYLSFDKFEMIGFLDNDGNKWGTMLDGYSIYDPRDIDQHVFDYIFVASTYREEITEQLLALGVEPEKIIDLYSLITPVSYGRVFVANSYIQSGKGYRYGIEIGAAHNPVHIFDGDVKVLQVDYCDHNTVPDDYFKQTKLELVKVDIIDDGETLDKIENNSMDFVISCHMLEHCKNPIGTLRNFLDKLKKNGIVFLAVPDKRYTFDKDRELTPIEHIMLDYHEPSSLRDRQHYFDKEVSLLTEEENTSIDQSIEKDIRIHYHVWDANSFIEFIYETRKVLNNSFTIEQIGNIDNGDKSNEILCVLKKIG